VAAMHPSIVATIDRRTFMDDWLRNGGAPGAAPPRDPDEL